MQIINCISLYCPISLFHTHKRSLYIKKNPAEDTVGFFVTHSTRKLGNWNNFYNLLAQVLQWQAGQTACPSLYSSPGQSRQINASVSFLHNKTTSETKIIDVSWQVIQIRSAQITTMLHRVYIVWCAPSPQSLHKLCHSIPVGVGKTRLQPLSHAVKGHRKYSLPDRHTANTPSLIT